MKKKKSCLQLRENFLDVRILFPREVDTEKDKIHLIGKKEDVLKVKKQLEAMITELVGFFCVQQKFLVKMKFI